MADKTGNGESNTGDKLRGASINGAPGSTILGIKDRWDPTAMPARAASGEADASVDLSGIGKGAA